MNEEYFYIIDHKNAFIPTNEDHQTKLRLNMLISCTSIDSSSIGNEINKYFTKLLPHNSSDLLIILSSLSKAISKDKSYLEKDKVHNVITWVISTSFCSEGVLELSLNNIEVIGSLLVHIFLEEIPAFKIKAYAKFTQLITQFIETKRDLIAAYDQFRLYTAKDSMSSNSKSTKKSSFELFKEKLTQSKAMDIPIELAFLIQKFRAIKKIAIPLEALTEYSFNLLLVILLNYSVFFTNCHSIDFDLTNTKLTTQLLRKYHRELIKTTSIHIKHSSNPNDELTSRRWTFTTNHIENLEQIYSTFSKNKLNSFDSTSDSSITVEMSQAPEEKHLSLTNDYKKLFELCIIYPYFISQWKGITSFQLISPNSFSKEVIELMQVNYNVLLMNYSLFDFFQPLCQLQLLTCEVNSLDSETFEKVISLIILNSKLNSLTLSLFSSDLYYLPAALFKLLNRLKVNIKSILQQNIISRTNTLDNDDVDQLFVNHLIRNFEENIEKLFWVIKDHAILRDINLFLVTPTLISNQENYMTILMKFVFNLLLFLNTGKTKVESFKLMVPYLQLDNRKSPGIYELFDYLDYEGNNTALTCLSIQMQFYSINNIGNILTTRLIEVNVGDFDKETFISFINKISEKEFTVKSSLRVINIALLGRVNQFSLIKESLMKYICLDIASLESIMLSSFLHLTIEELNRLYTLINYNSIKRYAFIFAKTCDSKMVPQLFYYNNCSSNEPVSKVEQAQREVFNNISRRVNNESGRALFNRLQCCLKPIKEKEVIVSYK